MCRDEKCNLIILLCEGHLCSPSPAQQVQVLGPVESDLLFASVTDSPELRARYGRVKNPGLMRVTSLKSGESGRAPATQHAVIVARACGRSVRSHDQVALQ